MDTILSHSDHNRLQAEYFGERAEVWHSMGLEFMARYYATIAFHCAHRALAGLPCDVHTYQPEFN